MTKDYKTTRCTRCGDPVRLEGDHHSPTRYYWCDSCGMETDAYYGMEEDFDPSPGCHVCGADEDRCRCGPIADNE